MRRIAAGHGVVYHGPVTLRPYTPADRDACLAIFDSDCPRYVAPEERPLFEAYLAAPKGRYAVLAADDGTIVGCGGVMTERDGREAHLTWGLIHAGHHRHGLGRAMTLERLRWIAEMPGIERVVMDTSQHTAGFYERLGFRLTRIVENGYAPGLHRHEMELRMDAAFRSRVFAEQWIHSAGQRKQA
jgi:ribosomal protein S18 acetylase RimI-like enzyme